MITVTWTYADADHRRGKGAARFGSPVAAEAFALSLRTRRHPARDVVVDASAVPAAPAPSLDLGPLFARRSA